MAAQQFDLGAFTKEMQAQQQPQQGGSSPSVSPQQTPSSSPSGASSSSASPASSSLGSSPSATPSSAGPVSPAPSSAEPSSPQSPPQSQTPEKQSVFKRILTAIQDPGAIAEGLMGGVLRAPGQLQGGVMDAGADVISAAAKAGGDKGDADQLGRNIMGGVADAAQQLLFPGLPLMHLTSMNTKASFQDTLSARDTVGRWGNNSVNQATANLASLVLGGESLGAVKGFAALGRLGSISARMGLVAGATINPTTDTGERFSNALSQLGLHTEFTDWLASDPKDESNMEARFKNSVDVALATPVADMVFKGAKWAYMAAKGAGAPEITAAAKAAQEAAKEVVPEAYRPADVVTKTSQRGTLAQQQGGVSNESSSTTTLTINGKSATSSRGGSSDGGVGAGADAGSGEAPVGKPAGQGQGSAAEAGASARDTHAALGSSGDETAPAEEQPVKFFAKPAGASDDSFEPVGSMSKDDLLKFHLQAKAYGDVMREGTKRGVDDPASLLDVRETPVQGAPDSEGVYKNLGQFTFSPLAQGKLAPFMRALADTLPATARPLADEDFQRQVGHLATGLGMDQSRAAAFVKDIAGSAKMLPQAAQTVRALWTNQVRALDALSAAGRDHIEALEGPELENALSQVHTASLWGAYDNDIGTGLGRALRARQLPDPASYFKDFDSTGKGNPEEGEQWGNYPLPKNTKELADWLDLWKTTGDDMNAKNDLLRGKMTVPNSFWYLRNSFANFYTGSILAGKAIVKGWLFPGFVSAIRTFEKTSGGFLAAMNPALDDQTRQSLLTAAKAAPQAYVRTMGDMTTALRFSLQSMRNGGQTIIGGGYSAKDAAQRLGPITDNMLQAAGQKPNLAYELGNLINFWPRQVFTAIGGHDEFTKRLGYLGETRVQAMVDGAQKGLQGQDLQDYMRGRMSAAIDPVSGAATDSTLLNRGARSSLMNSTQTSPMGPLIRGLDKARNAVPELRYILPVFDVPANGLGEGIRRIPILNFALKETRADLVGDNGAVAQAEAHGRMLTGAAALGVGFSYARSGMLTGAGPTDPRQYADWALTHRPYSINVPGVGWVSYKDYEPIGSLLGVIGSVYDKSVYMADDKDWSQHMLAGAGALAEYFKDKGALQQLSEVLNFGGDPLNSKATVQRFFGSTASGFIPAFVKYTRNIDDPVMRQKNSPFDYILDSLPGYSKQLDPVRNVLGQPLHIPNDSILENTMPITISETNPQNADSVIKELDHIYELTGYAAGVSNQSTLSHGYYDARAVKLEDGRSMYDHYIDARNDPIVGDQNVRQALDELFQSDDYKEATYGSASSTFDATEQPSKLKMVADLFKQYNAAARQQVATDSPLARRYLAVTAIKRTSPDILGGHSAEDLVKQPELLKALGIDVQDYEDNITQGATQ